MRGVGRVGVMGGVVAVWVLAGAVMGGNVDRVMTLDQSIQTGLQNNQSLLTAVDDVRLAQQRIVEARSLYFPTLAVNANASHYRANDYVALPGEFGSTVLTPTTEPGRFYAGRLSLRQMIYNGGRNRANLQMAEAALAQARIQEESIRGQVTVDTIKAFYDVLLAQKKLGLVQEAWRAVSAITDDRSGAVGAALARLRRDQAQRGREWESAKLAFLGACGLELYTEVRLTGELATDPINESLPKLLARAQETRLEIRGTEYQREIDRLAVNLSESERDPTVVFGAAYELNNDVFPLDRAFWNATLNVNVPIFDGFSSRARIRQTRLLANQNRIARAQVEDRVNREVRESYADGVFWQSEMEQRRLDAARLRVLAEDGSAARSARDRCWLWSERVAAEDAYWESVHGHRVARARLEKAVGSPLQP